MSAVARERDSPRCDVLGVPFFAGSFHQAAQITIRRALSGSGGYATLTGVHGLTLAQEDDAVRTALQTSWINFPDGVPITWIQHRTGARSAERVCGIDLMPLVLELGQESGLRHFLFGSTNPVLAALEHQIATRWPRATVVGSESPPFGSIGAHRDTGAIERIRATSPHIVWVGLGAPKQDLWARQHADALRPAVVLCVGAAFDYVAATKRRAPRWMQLHGLEWLFRMASEPRRLTGRYLRANSQFAFHAIRRRAVRDATSEMMAHRPGSKV